MRDGQHQPQPSKKRQHGTAPLPYSGRSQAAQSHPDISAATREPPGPGFTQRSSTFPRQGPKSEPNSFIGSSPWSSTSVSSPFGPAATSPNAFDQRGFPQDFSAPSSNPMQHATQQHMPLPPNFANPAIPDVSAMMFPSGGDEPFLYPNQPLTTFENNQQFVAAAANAGSKQSNPYLANMVNGGGAMDTPHTQPQQLFPNTTPPSRGGRDDNMEAQFFALPPYLEQSRSQQRNGPPASFPSDNVGFNGGPALPPMTPNPHQQQQHQANMGRMTNGWPQQQPSFNGMQPQQDFNNINIQDLFGGAEWNAMIMDPGFRQ
jgi:hypothetical protein